MLNCHCRYVEDKSIANVDSEDIMRIFYRTFFNGGAASAAPEDAPFHSLYEFTTTFGSNVYSLIVEIIIFLVLISTGIHFIKGYAAKDAQKRVETKDKIMYNALVLLLVINLTFIINTVYTLFHW